MIKPDKCELCQREMDLTFHHLIPVTLHSNKWFKKNFTREQMSAGIYICDDCHKAVHKFISEKELGRDYNTIDKLMAHDKVSGFVKWISKR